MKRPSLSALRPEQFPQRLRLRRVLVIDAVLDAPGDHVFEDLNAFFRRNGQIAVKRIGDDKLQFGRRGQADGTDVHLVAGEMIHRDVRIENEPHAWPETDSRRSAADAAPSC